MRGTDIWLGRAERAAAAARGTGDGWQTVSPVGRLLIRPS